MKGDLEILLILFSYFTFHNFFFKWKACFSEILTAFINFRVDYYFYVSKFFSISRKYNMLPAVTSFFPLMLLYSLEARWDSRVTTGNSGFLLCWPRKSNLPFELRGKAEGCTRVTAFLLFHIGIRYWQNHTRRKGTWRMNLEMHNCLS